MTNGAKKSSSGVQEPEDAVAYRLQKDGAMIAKVAERDGCRLCKTGLFGEPWERPASSSGRLSADVMVMND